MKIIRDLLKNKTAIAIVCFVLAGFIGFIIVPVNDNVGEKVNVIKVSKMISENTKISEDMIKSVSCNKDDVPSEALTDKKDIVGKYANVNLYPTDYITNEKLSVIEVGSNLFNLNEGEMAISITPKTLSSSVSSNLLVGDAVQLYGYNTEEKAINEDSGKWHFEVLAIDNSKAENVSGVSLDEVSDIVPAAITIRVTNEEQVKSVVNMEMNNDIQVIFSGRGETADELLGR